jgi:tetratricopeptide (TPR) repeat protein
MAPPKPRWELWQIVAGGAIIVVVAVFVYAELRRSYPPSASGSQNQAAALPPDMTGEIERLQKVVELNPADAASILRLANLLHDNGSRDPQSVVRAVQMYKKYLELNPDNPDARVDLGVCYFELGRGDSAKSRDYFTSAANEMGKAYAAHPTHQTAAFNLGIVNLYAGNLEVASKWFTRAVEIDANSALGTRAKQLLEQHSVTSSSQ